MSFKLHFFAYVPFCYLRFIFLLFFLDLLVYTSSNRMEGKSSYSPLSLEYYDSPNAPERVRVRDRVMISEGEHTSLQCSADGNPTPTLAWTRDIHTHNRTARTLASGLGVVTLEVHQAVWADTGVYLCHAKNVVATVPPVTTKLIVKQPVTGVMGMSGGRGSWAALGTSGRLLCRMRAAPKPTFVWTTHDGTKLHNSEKYVIHAPQLVDGLVLWSSILEVRHVERRDYATYRCTAHNGLGSHSTTVALSPPSRPHPPVNFTVFNVTAVSVSLAWTPNFDGGMPRGYTVKYRQKGSSEYQLVQISGGNTAGTTLSGLTPGADYLYTIQARNEQGASAYVSPPALVTMLGVGAKAGSQAGGAGQSRVPRLMLLILTLTGAALLVLNVAIIACFVRRRSVNRSASARKCNHGFGLAGQCINAQDKGANMSTLCCSLQGVY
ncbi:nephrin-like [Penaeus chinensis]|uniref:nephrin-like n=1 Tax=Penaeus chinensis TaxID=139456 RepID=UPI001FB825A4|nr:nephrin-like [Penaeus chinensis]